MEPGAFEARLRAAVICAKRRALGICSALCVVVLPSRSLAGQEKLTGVIDTARVLTLGAAERGGFFDVLGGAFCDGGLVVAERSSGTLQFHDRNGRLTRTAGGRGAGPGQFQRMLWMRHARGHLAVYDFSARRVTEYSCSGELLATRSRSGDGRFANTHAVGVFADGSLLAESIPRVPPVRTPQVVRSAITLIRVDGQSDVADSIGHYVGREFYKEPYGRAGEATVAVLFGRHSLSLATDAGYFVIQNDDDAIGVYSDRGILLRFLRSPPAAARAITAEDVAQARRARMQAMGSAGASVAALLGRMPIPRVFPRYGWFGSRGLAVARTMSDGTLWVVNGGGTRGDYPTWSVFAGGTALLGQVAASEELDVLDVSGNHALVLAWDVDGVERVEVRRVHWR